MDPHGQARTEPIPPVNGLHTLRFQVPLQVAWEMCVGGMVSRDSGVHSPTARWWYAIALTIRSLMMALVPVMIPDSGQQQFILMNFIQELGESGFGSACLFIAC